MENASPLATLCSLAQQALEQATLNLGQVRRSCVQAEEQLSMLLNYQSEYQQRLNLNMSDGIAAATWRNYQQFITTLELAIEQHRKQLELWNKRLDNALSEWQEKQQKLNAYQTLQQRADEKLRIQENRLDQKQTDEYAQRSAQRKNQ
jgi:flagellar FliJ protein